MEMLKIACDRLDFNINCAESLRFPTGSMDEKSIHLKLIEWTALRQRVREAMATITDIGKMCEINIP